MKAFLKDWQIVILRAHRDARVLSLFIKQQGGEPLVLPVLKIMPLKISAQQLTVHQSLITQATLLIVSSRNALLHAPPLLLQTLAQQTHLKIFAMGKSSAQHLVQKGIHPFYVAPPGSSSETLLAHPLLQAPQVAHQSVILLAGEGGSPLLAQVLKQRQASIHWIKVYQQQGLPLKLQPLLKIWQQSSQRIAFIVGSLNGLKNFLAHVPLVDQIWLTKQVLIVLSEKMAYQAQVWGFKQLLIAPGADREGMKEALLQLRHL